VEESARFSSQASSFIFDQISISSAGAEDLRVICPKQRSPSKSIAQRIIALAWMMLAGRPGPFAPCLNVAAVQIWRKMPGIDSERGVTVCASFIHSRSQPAVRLATDVKASRWVQWKRSVKQRVFPSVVPFASRDSSAAGGLARRRYFTMMPFTRDVSHACGCVITARSVSTISPELHALLSASATKSTVCRLSLRRSRRSARETPRADLPCLPLPARDVLFPQHAAAQVSAAQPLLSAPS
jgi:hypothetical protein